MACVLLRIRCGGSRLGDDLVSMVPRYAGRKELANATCARVRVDGIARHEEAVSVAGCAAFFERVSALVCSVLLRAELLYNVAPHVSRQRARFQRGQLLAVSLPFTGYGSSSPRSNAAPQLRLVHAAIVAEWFAVRAHEERVVKRSHVVRAKPREQFVGHIATGI